MARALFITAILGLSSNAFAALDIPGLSQAPMVSSTISDKALAKTGLSVYQDDITAEQYLESMKLDEHALHQARVWGLTEQEEKRYLALIQNRSAVFYEGLHLTPIDILGLNARNEAERAHFAQLGAQIESQKVAQNLAWNNAFYKAYNELFKNNTVVSADFDPTPYSPVAHKPVHLQTGDELFLFLTPMDASKNIVMTLSDAVVHNPGTKLHFMVLNADDKAIQELAHRFGLSYESVKLGLITLNHGELHFEGLTLTDKQTPLLILVRHGASSVVDLGRI